MFHCTGHWADSLIQQLLCRISGNLNFRKKTEHNITTERTPHTVETLLKDGTYETGPFYYDENPLESVVVYVGCNPDYCYCKNNPTEAKDTRPLELRAIIDLCPANQGSHLKTQSRFLVQ